MQQQIKIAIVDDHKLFRNGIKQIFDLHSDFSVILACEDGVELLEELQSKTQLPDVILLDMKMPRINGIDCLRELNSIYPEHKTIILSMYDDNPIIKKALKEGARGYLLKNAETEELFDAIRAVHSTGYYICAELSKCILEGFKNPSTNDKISAFNPKHLNAVELEVLKYICQGLTNQEIGDLVHRSKRTIEGYRQKLINKSGAKNTAALVAWAFRRGLVD